ncbi:hypothetical protein ACOME3_000597 [Neoechinorhynchus agilis]
MKAEPGVMVRQTPADVVEWMGVSAGGLGLKESSCSICRSRQWGLLYACGNRRKGEDDDPARKRSWEKAGPDVVPLEMFRWGMPKKSEMLTEEAVCGKMGIPFFQARKLGGPANLGGKGFQVPANKGPVSIGLYNKDERCKYLSDEQRLFSGLRGAGFINRQQLNQLGSANAEVWLSTFDPSFNV